MYIIDTHAHIYLPAFDEDRGPMLERAKASGVEMILMPAIDSSTHDPMLKLENQFSFCKAMMGVHPCSVTDGWQKEVKLAEEYLQQRSFVAIGEIGLDFHWDRTFTKQQYEAFYAQIELALHYQLPIVIHSRNAIEECIEAIQKYPSLTGVFHCFSGNYEQAVKIMDSGFYLGIGGVVTFKNSGLDKTVEKAGLSQAILETDAPYLAPMPHRGKRNEPSYTRYVMKKLSVVLNKCEEEIAELTTENARKLFKL